MPLDGFGDLLSNLRGQVLVVSATSEVAVDDDFVLRIGCRCGEQRKREAQDADEQPVSAVVEASNERIAAFRAVVARWDAVVKTDVPALNVRLKAAGAAEVRVP